MTAGPGGAAAAPDCDGHGTHVAAVAVGRTVGVAKAAALVAVRVLACDGSGSVGDVVAGAGLARNAGTCDLHHDKRFAEHRGN